ncbi:MAG: sirohydrochlorin chelatase [Lautropia sp.]
MRACVFFCHGSRDPAWRVPFDRLVAEQRARQPAVRTEIAFLELMAPSLPETLDALAADGCDEIAIVPLFLAPGAHTRVDLPALADAAQRRWPRLQLRIMPTLLESPAVRAAVLAGFGE